MMHNTRLSTNVPVQASSPASIRTGDLMLYGSNTLVLFYKSFHTTYSYTVIGRIDEPAGLEVALGTGDIDVTFGEISADSPGGSIESEDGDVR